MKIKKSPTALSNRQPHFMRLGQMKNELSSMLSKLNSYLYEPCTSEMYSQYSELHDNGILLQQAINKVNKNSNNAIYSSANRSNDIDVISKKYRAFQKSLFLYLSEAKVHH